MYDPQRCVLKAYRAFTEQSSYHLVYLYWLGWQSAVCCSLSVCQSVILSVSQSVSQSISDRRLLKSKAVQNLVLRESVAAIRGEKTG